MNTVPKRSKWTGKPAKARIEVVGHRHFVGGTDAESWYALGRLQYHYLVKWGLKPGDVFLDLGCGSLRLGQFLIPYLDAGKYFGFEPESDLVRAGLDHELMPGLIEAKKPVFDGNYHFDFGFVEKFDVAWAQSVFTHLTEQDIATCFANLLPHCKVTGCFHFTFFEGDPSGNPKIASHANKSWRYRFRDLENIAAPTGWKLTYVGDWGHRRKQKMVIAEPR
ncbi:MAG: class I SAM-dependent methyltransferase [Rhodobacteraceae bacterium]|nr:MAG: class I SAM-dependent methyltransferase [Paracoccaceae bacterium]